MTPFVIVPDFVPRHLENRHFPEDLKGIRIPPHPLNSFAILQRKQHFPFVFLGGLRFGAIFCVSVRTLAVPEIVPLLPLIVPFF